MYASPSRGQFQSRGFRVWHSWVTAIGYIGLGLFLALLGYLAEFYRQTAMQERDEAVRRLSVLNEEKNEFLGIAAHDLNNPLSVVQGYAQMIQEGGEADELMEYAELIEESAARMRKIVRDVLDVNQIDSGTYPLECALQPLAPLVDRTYRAYLEPAARKDLNWEIQLDSAMCVFDPGAMGQVVDNLVSNAVKYAKPGGQLGLCIEEVGGVVVLTVRNEGRGFSDQDLEKLFQRYTTLSTRPTGGEASVGLGLSITQKLVDVMGGSIRCESRLNEYAAFKVSMPTSG